MVEGIESPSYHSSPNPFLTSNETTRPSIIPPFTSIGIIVEKLMTKIKILQSQSKSLAINTNEKLYQRQRWMFAFKKMHSK
jgi:hypothetical protein